MRFSVICKSFHVHFSFFLFWLCNIDMWSMWQFNFGVLPSPQEDDSALKEPCLELCPSATRRREVTGGMNVLKCPKAWNYQSILSSQFIHTLNVCIYLKKFIFMQIIFTFFSPIRSLIRKQHLFSDSVIVRLSHYRDRQK